MNQEMMAEQDLLVRKRLIALQRQMRKEREEREDTERRRAALASSSASGNANDVVLIDSDPETDTDTRAQRGSGLLEEVDLTVASVGSRSAAPRSVRVAHLAPASSTASSSVSTSVHHSPVSVDSDSDVESVHSDDDVVFVGSSRPIVQPPPSQAPSHQYHRNRFSVNSVFNDMFASILSPHARHPDIRYDPYPMRQPSPPAQKPPPRPRVIVLQPSEPEPDDPARIKCAICLSTPSAAKTSLVVTTCGHIFCEDCIKQSFKSSVGKKCPTCRKAQTAKNSLRNIFV